MLPSSAATSLMRLEKPHSLSYQESTRTKRPSMTWVWLRSKVELAWLWLKSIETSGSSLISSTPESGPAAAALTAVLISSALVSRPAVKVKSINDTFGVGTRMAVPSSLPASSGSTRPTARAAPVEVGIIELAAARARCRSLCKVSSTGWSPV